MIRNRDVIEEFAATMIRAHGFVGALEYCAARVSGTVPSDIPKEFWEDVIRVIGDTTSFLPGRCDRT